MASLVNAFLCALVATAFWTVLGHALGRHLLPRPLALGAAPVLGWAVFSAVTLPVLTLIGFSLPALIGAVMLCLVAAGASLLLPSGDAGAGPAPAIPLWSFAAAAVLALAPASALLPKFANGGIHLAGQIFDHAKIATIDAMTRQGLPPVNPVFGVSGAPGHLAYYYLWHFSAAELALTLHVSGWEADIGLTWFTAFASLSLMMGIAVWLSKRSEAAILAVALAASASLRGTFGLLFGNYTLEPLLQGPTGFAGWLFQSSWVPQHLMSASCAVAAMLLRRPLRAAAERGAVGGAAFARRRRFRKLGLCRRGDLRAGGRSGGAAGIRRCNAGAAPDRRRRPDRGCRWLDLAWRAVHPRSVEHDCRARRRSIRSRFSPSK